MDYISVKRGRIFGSDTGFCCERNIRFFPTSSQRNAGNVYSAFVTKITSYGMINLSSFVVIVSRKLLDNRTAAG